MFRILSKRVFRISGRSNLLNFLNEIFGFLGPAASLVRAGRLSLKSLDFLGSGLVKLLPLLLEEELDELNLFLNLLVPPLRREGEKEPALLVVAVVSLWKLDWVWRSGSGSAGLGVRLLDQKRLLLLLKPNWRPDPDLGDSSGSSIGVGVVVSAGLCSRDLCHNMNKNGYGTIKLTKKRLFDSLNFNRLKQSCKNCKSLILKKENRLLIYLLTFPCRTLST